MDFGIGEVWFLGVVMIIIKLVLKRWKLIKKIMNLKLIMKYVKI